jgi:hypothetical protein
VNTCKRDIFASLCLSAETAEAAAEPASEPAAETASEPAPAKVAAEAAASPTVIRPRDAAPTIVTRGARL